MMSYEPWNGGILGDVGRDIDNIRLRNDVDGLAQGLAKAHAELEKAQGMISELRKDKTDFRVAIMDVARAINDPRLNAALKVERMKAQANNTKIEVMKGVLRLERRSRWVLEEALNVLAQKHGIPSKEKDEIVKKCFEASMRDLPEDKIPIGIKLDRPKDFLFLDDTVKRLNAEGDKWFEHIDEADAAEKEFRDLENICKRREAEQEARLKQNETREAN